MKNTYVHKRSTNACNNIVTVLVKKEDEEEEGDWRIWKCIPKKWRKKDLHLNVKQGWKKFLYFLDGVVEQSGNLMGGHYTAEHQHSAPRPTSSVVIRFLLWSTSTRECPQNGRHEEEAEENNIMRS
ncbi:hypothetical protein CHS0354_007057 [Potamilus streckersoni]|uniref:Uncharacterized protein n=1 Tax=Potamilus streckersoni TaxID=2493646 RepID=A0AAE0SCC5_9BIVA|nr:hypothetical protein CHS0354_007057 [Potamilus streckersoni]